MSHVARTIVRNSAFGIAAQFAIRGLSFAFSILIVRRLGAEAYGQYSAVLAFGAMFVFLADLGLSPYALREIARWHDAPDGSERADQLGGNVLVLRFLLSVTTAILLISAAWMTGRPLVMVGAIALGTLGLIMYSIQGTANAILGGFERLDLTAGANVANLLAFVLIGAVALLLGAGYYGLIGANLIGVALMTAMCWRGMRRLGVRPRQITPRIWPFLVRSSVPFGIIGFALGLSYKFDSVLLNVFRSDVETGYYNAAYNLVFSAIVLSNAINVSLYPTLTRQATVDPESLPGIYARLLRYLNVISLPIAFGTATLAGRLIPFLFTAAYLPSVPALQILVWVTPLMFASEFLGYIIVIRGDETKVARSVLVSTACNVALNLIVVPRFGYIGASVMTVATEAVLVGQYVWLLRSYLRRFDWSHTFLRPLIAASLMGGVLQLLPIKPLPVTVVLGALLYVGLLALLRVIGQDEVTFVRGLRRPMTTAHMPLPAGPPVS